MTSPLTAVTFTGGLRTPTGTRFHVSAGWRACFDLGMAFTPASSFFDGRVQVRPDRLLADLLMLGLAPPLPGLYRADALRSTGLAPGPDGRTAIFISHLHLDHMSLLRFVADEIPVYMSRATAELLTQLEGAGLGSGVNRTVSVMDSGQTVTLGDLAVTAMAVDHDIPGALAFLIDTPDGVIAYSGDLRTHGYRGEASRAFVSAAAARRPQALVIETTRMGEEPVRMLTETEVIEAMAKIGAEAAGLVLVLPYPRNVERLRRLPEAARRMGRRFVVEASVAPLLGKPLADEVLVFDDDAVAGRDQAAAATKDGVVAEIRRDPARYFVQLSYPRLATLADLQPPPGSLLLHSDGEPIGPFDPATANLMRWLDRFQVSYQVVRSSGHAAPSELLQMAADIAPKVVFPLHGFRPDLLIVPGLRQVLPVADVAYRLDGSPASG